jgi:hypothetical protein
MVLLSSQIREGEPGRSESRLRAWLRALGWMGLCFVVGQVLAGASYLVYRFPDPAAAGLLYAAIGFALVVGGAWVAARRGRASPGTVAIATAFVWGVGGVAELLRASMVATSRAPGWTVAIAYGGGVSVAAACAYVGAQWAVRTERMGRRTAGGPQPISPTLDPRDTHRCE